MRKRLYSPGSLATSRKVLFLQNTDGAVSRSIFLSVLQFLLKKPKGAQKPITKQLLEAASGVLRLVWYTPGEDRVGEQSCIKAA